MRGERSHMWCNGGIERNGLGIIRDGPHIVAFYAGGCFDTLVSAECCIRGTLEEGMDGFFFITAVALLMFCLYIFPNG